jgi:hypothetical protein
VRREPSVANDLQFLHQVRGRIALSKLTRLEGRIRSLFNKRQIAELSWERRCFRCGAIPEGVVMRNGQEIVEFRCPLGECTFSETKTRTILLEPRLLDAITRKYNLPISECLLRIIGTIHVIRQATTGARGPVAPIHLRLPLSIHYFYTDQDIVALLEAAARGE